MSSTLFSLHSGRWRPKSPTLPPPSHLLYSRPAASALARTPRTKQTTTYGCGHKTISHIPCTAPPTSRWPLPLSLTFFLAPQATKYEPRNCPSCTTALENDLKNAATRQAHIRANAIRASQAEGRRNPAPPATGTEVTLQVLASSSDEMEFERKLGALRRLASAGGGGGSERGEMPWLQEEITMFAERKQLDPWELQREMGVRAQRVLDTIPITPTPITVTAIAISPDSCTSTPTSTSTILPSDTQERAGEVLPRRGRLNADSTWVFSVEGLQLGSPDLSDCDTFPASPRRVRLVPWCGTRRVDAVVESEGESASEDKDGSEDMVGSEVLEALLEEVPLLPSRPGIPAPSPCSFPLPDSAPASPVQASTSPSTSKSPTLHPSIASATSSPAFEDDSELSPVQSNTHLPANPTPAHISRTTTLNKLFDAFQELDSAFDGEVEDEAEGETHPVCYPYNMPWGNTSSASLGASRGLEEGGKEDEGCEYDGENGEEMKEETQRGWEREVEHSRSGSRIEMYPRTHAHAHPPPSSHPPFPSHLSLSSSTLLRLPSPTTTFPSSSPGTPLTPLSPYTPTTHLALLTPSHPSYAPTLQRIYTYFSLPASFPPSSFPFLLRNTHPNLRLGFCSPSHYYRISFPLRDLMVRKDSLCPRENKYEWVEREVPFVVRSKEGRELMREVWGLVLRVDWFGGGAADGEEDVDKESEGLGEVDPVGEIGRAGDDEEAFHWEVEEVSDADTKQEERTPLTIPHEPDSEAATTTRTDSMEDQEEEQKQPPPPTSTLIPVTTPILNLTTDQKAELLLGLGLIF